jgi:hypothetical protein
MNANTSKIESGRQKREKKQAKGTKRKYGVK